MGRRECLDLLYHGLPRVNLYERNKKKIITKETIFIGTYLVYNSEKARQLRPMAWQSLKLIHKVVAALRC